MSKNACSYDLGHGLSIKKFRTLRMGFKTRTYGIYFKKVEQMLRRCKIEGYNF